MTKRVLILGVNGMLGHTCFEHFNSLREFEIIGTWRGADFENIKSFDVTNGTASELVKEVRPDWIINCIGVIKQKIQDENQDSIDNAILINSVFPKELSSAVSGSEIKVLQIATDCVFSGEIGGYNEQSLHDATDLYGQSKSRGEIQAPEFMNIRASIIGREKGSSYSLTDWFLSRNYGSTVDGYTNHLWNGITTLAFARIASGIIEKNEFVKGTFNIVPSGQISKYALLQLLRVHYNREDLLVIPTDESNFVDRTLSTIYPELNERLWKAAGYEKIPTIETLIKEFATYN